MAKVDLVVGIGAEYKGKPAFKKALWMPNRKTL
jgi:hypothetical protein